MSNFSRFAADETLSVEDVRDLIVNGKIAATDLLSRDSSTEWKRANEFAELRRYFEHVPAVHRELRPLPHFEPKFTPPKAPSSFGSRFVSREFLPLAVIGFVACVFVIAGVDEFVREMRSMSEVLGAQRTGVWPRGRRCGCDPTRMIQLTR